MTWIQKSVVLAVVFYIILMIAEIYSHPQVIFEAIIGSILLGCIAAVFLYRDNHRLHSGEMILIWVMILIFVCYGIFCLTGVNL